MRQNSERAIQQVLLAISTFAFVIAVPIISWLVSTDDDPNHLTTGLFVYAIFLLGLSLTGFVAAIKHNSTLITICAIHLLIDSALFFIPRLLFIRLSFSFPSLICSTSSRRHTEDLVVSDPDRPVKTIETLGWALGDCLTWMWTLEILFVAVFLAHAALQAVVSVRLFRYAAWLNRRRKIEMARIEL